MRNIIAKGSEDGIGMSARKTADGRCVNTIVYVVSELQVRVRVGDSLP